MPRWDFRCPSCGVVQTFTFASYEQMLKTLVTCDPDGACDGHRMERILSAPNVHFSGAGWTPKHCTK